MKNIVRRMSFVFALLGCLFVSACAVDELSTPQEEPKTPPPKMQERYTPVVQNPINIRVLPSPEKITTQIVVPTDDAFGMLVDPTFNEVAVMNDSDVPIVVLGAKIEQINNHADTLDCEQVMLTYIGNVLVRAHKATGSVWETYRVGETDWLLPGESWLVKVACRIAVPQPFSAVGGGWYSAARSGHTPQLRLNELTVKSALDERTATVHPMLAGPPMLLRKSAPLVNAYPSDRPLTGNGSGSLYTETVVARGGPVAIKHRELTFERSPGSSFTVTNLTLLRNGIPIDRETYTISFYVSPVRYALTTLPSDVLASAVYIEFHQEEVVRRYNVYELRGTVNGAEKNDRLMIYSWRSQNRSAQMGQIQPMQYGAYPLRLVDNGTTPAYAGHILWSDLSEDPHSDQFFPRGSNDWMTDYLVAPDPERVTLHF